MLNTLFWEMIRFYCGDAKRIQHFVKVHAFAKLIGEMEDIEEGTLRILEVAAYVHDIGIKPAEEKYGTCGGKLQEQEEPAVAKEVESESARICLIYNCHLHTLPVSIHKISLLL